MNNPKPVVSVMGNTEAITDLVMGKRPAAFVGETMTCCICGATRKSDPSANTDWRALDLDTKRFYACEKEFPPDGSSSELFKQAYLKFLRRAQKG